jgi:hypothetical protein
MLSALLYSNAPAVYKTVPTIYSLDLWRQGASERTFRILNRLGLTLSAIQTRAAVDNITADYDSYVKEWKNRVEKVNTLKVIQTVKMNSPVEFFT